MELGYYDTLRAFGRIRGCAYAVDSGADSSADAEAFRAAFDAVQKEVREKYPVTLTADAALLLARMKDAQLAPLEAAAVHGQQHRRAGGAGRFAAQYILTGAGVAHFDRIGFAGGDRR